MREFQPFVMERMMSRFEQTVDYNLSESGVHPVTLGELLEHDPGSREKLTPLIIGSVRPGTPSTKFSAVRRPNGGGNSVPTLSPLIPISSFRRA